MRDTKTLIAGLVDLAEYHALCDHIDDIEKTLYAGLATTYDEKELLRKTRFWQAFRLIAHVIKVVPVDMRNQIEAEFAQDRGPLGLDPLMPFSRQHEFDEA